MLNAGETAEPTASKIFDKLLLSGWVFGYTGILMMFRFLHFLSLKGKARKIRQERVAV